jgi:hypothetical protein
MGMFTAPKVIEAPAKKAAKPSAATVEIPGVEQLAMIDALQKTLETLRGTIDTEVKAVALTRFMAHIKENGTRPDSFKGTEGGASATISLGRKSSTAALSDAAVTLLRSHKIEPEKLVTTPELFAINPKYAGDTALLGKVEKALTKIVPEDFILQQAEQHKLVATEETFDAAIKAKLPVEVIQSLTSMSCAPKLLKTDIHQILDFVRDLIGAPVFGTAAEQSKTVKLSLVKQAA